MNECDVEKIIVDTVNMTVLKLKVAGLMKDGCKSAYQKTEELLINYNAFKQSDQPYTKKLVKNIDCALDEIRDDIYFEIITLFYFKNWSRDEVADYFNTTPTTISRNKKRLIDKLKVKLFSDDVIYDLFCN